MAAAADPDEVLRPTDGKANFHRLVRLLISGGTSLLREIFDAVNPPSNLPTVLSNPATKIQLKAAKLTKPQWDCLYPSSGVYGNSTDFDVTLLFRLIRTICNLTPPPTGWDALPTNTDHSLTADLVRIKYYRNSVYGHANQKMEIPDGDFLSLWQEISEALVRIASQISGEKKTAWQKAIDNFRKDLLTADDERNVQELERWYKNDMDVKKSMEELKTTTQEGIDRLVKDCQVKFGETSHMIEKGAQCLETAVLGEHQVTRKELNTTLRKESRDIQNQLGEMHQSIERLNSSAANSQSIGACLRLTIDCEAITGPETGSSGMVITPHEPQTVKQETGVVPVTSNQSQAVITTGARREATVIPSPQEPQVVVHGASFLPVTSSPSPAVVRTSTQAVFNEIALKFLQSVDPSNREDRNDYLEYLKEVRKVLFVDAHSGSLIIRVECSSLQILDELWEDYRIGHLNEMAEKFLVTEDILKKFGLIAVKLSTTIVEKEYRVCREYFLKRSATKKGKGKGKGKATDSPALGKDDSSVIVQKIFEQFEQLRRHREDLHNAFLRWIPIRARTMEQLDKLATNLDEHKKKLNKAKISGASIGTAGGMLVLGGVFAIPFTFGASITVSLVGAGITGAGVLLLSGSKAVKKVLVKSDLKEVRAAIKEDCDACSELQQHLDSLENFISTLAEFLKPRHDDAVLLRELERSDFEFLRERIDSKDISSFTEARLKASVINVIGDVESLARSSLTLRTVRDIRKILNNMNCPNEDEIQGLVDSFIDLKFTEAYHAVIIPIGVKTKTDVLRLLESGV